MYIYGPPISIGIDGKYHYVYRITNLKENKHYYGSRTSLVSPFEDLGKKYFSSAYSNYWIKKDQKENPQNYKYKIIKTFANRPLAVKFEHNIHTKFNVAVSTLFYNNIIQAKYGGYVEGKSILKDKDGNFFQVDKNDPRYILGDLSGVVKGTTVVKDKNGKHFRISIHDPRFISGELVSVALNKVTVKNKQGNQFVVDTSDPRYVSGELVSIMDGKTMVKDTNGNIFWADKLDPRHGSGELISATKDKVIVKDMNGNTSLVDRCNPRYVSGELVGVAKGTVGVIDTNGNTFRVSKDDPRYIFGELIPLTKGKITVKDKYGNTFRVSPNDPKYVSGEFTRGLGFNNVRCKFWRVTPWGIYNNNHETPCDMNICWRTINRMCSNDNMVMSKYFYNKYKIIRDTFGAENIGKTFNELGFYNINKEEYKLLMDIAS